MPEFDLEPDEYRAEEPPGVREPFFTPAAPTVFAVLFCVVVAFAFAGQILTVIVHRLFQLAGWAA